MRTILTLALTLGGCVTTPVATVQPICGTSGTPGAIRTVWISKDDILTEQTASQIEGNNLARAKLCGKSKPPPQEMKPPAAAFKKVPTS